MVNYHLNVFPQKVAHYYILATYVTPIIVPTIKNTKSGDLTSPIGAVCRDSIDNNGEQINASEEKLKEVMKEMNQALNVLSGSVIAPDSATSQVWHIINMHR